MRGYLLKTYFVCFEGFGAIVKCECFDAKGAKGCSESNGSGGDVSTQIPSDGNYVGWPTNQITRATCILCFRSDKCCGEAVHTHR